MLCLVAVPASSERVLQHIWCWLRGCRWACKTASWGRCWRACTSPRTPWRQCRVPSQVRSMDCSSRSATAGEPSLECLMSSD